MVETVKHTPGPWFLAEIVENKFQRSDMRRLRSKHEGYKHGAVCEVYGSSDGSVASANARLISEAPDLALLLWAMCVGSGRWEPLGDLTGEFCINGIRHLTRLDDNGCPQMTDGMRAAILKSRGRS